MKQKTVVRFYDPDRGWYHALLIKRGRKWATVRDFSPPKKNKDGVYTKRNRKVRIDSVAEPLWEVK